MNSLNKKIIKNIVIKGIYLIISILVTQILL